MEEQTKTKNKIPVLALVIIVVIIAILFAVFRDAPSVNAPTTNDAVDTMQPAVDSAPTTTQAASPSVPTPSNSVVTNPVAADKPQVIIGDGFTATIRPVTETGEVPVITSFTMQQKEDGSSCLFTWEVEKATSCDVVNPTNKTAVTGVPTSGSLQTNDAGTYQLKCKGVGGKVALSEVQTCK